MTAKLTDLKQLAQAILKESPPSRHVVEKPAPEPLQSRKDAAAVLA